MKQQNTTSSAAAPLGLSRGLYMAIDAQSGGGASRWRRSKHAGGKAARKRRRK